MTTLGNSAAWKKKSRVKILLMCCLFIKLCLENAQQQCQLSFSVYTYFRELKIKNLLDLTKKSNSPYLVPSGNGARGKRYGNSSALSREPQL